MKKSLVLVLTLVVALVGFSGVLNFGLETKSLVADKTEFSTTTDYLLFARGEFLGFYAAIPLGEGTYSDDFSHINTLIYTEEEFSTDLLTVGYQINPALGPIEIRASVETNLNDITNVEGYNATLGLGLKFRGVTFQAGVIENLYNVFAGEINPDFIASVIITIF